MTIDTDLFVVVGFMLAVLSLPSALGAYAEGVLPKVSLIIMGLGIIISLFAALTSPDGYSMGRLPHSFIEILARIVN
jgi:hypothetical protein